MDTPWCEFYKLLMDWQTLLGALIALAAAFWTIRVMRFQAADESRRHKNQIHRKKKAARAQMPDALGGLTDYVRATVEYLTGQTEGVPEAPALALTTLKQVIEHIDDTAATRTFELVSLYQVQRARMPADGPPQMAGPSRRDRFYDVILLQAHINSLFDYARNEKQTAPTEMPSQEDMAIAKKNAFLSAHIMQNEQNIEGLNEIIISRHKSVKVI